MVESEQRSISLERPSLLFFCRERPPWGAVFERRRVLAFTMALGSCVWNSIEAPSTLRLGRRRVTGSMHPTRQSQSLRHMRGRHPFRYIQPTSPLTGTSVEAPPRNTLRPVLSHSVRRPGAAFRTDAIPT